jgi:hypothetical protein
MSAAYISLTVSADVSPASFHKWKYCWMLWQYVVTLRASTHKHLEPQRFFYCWSWNFCFKWTRTHGQLFHRSVFPNATCFTFWVVQWLHSGWRWQCNMKEHTYLRAQAEKQPHGHQSSSTVPSKSTHPGSRLQDFWQWEINDWGGEKAGTVQLIDWLISIWVRALTVLLHLDLI